jgi:hypothetical protein
MIAALAFAAALALQSAKPAPPAHVTPAQIETSLHKCLAFLRDDRNQDGSWGSARNGTYFDFWSNPETQRSWRVGTTALGCMAFLESGAAEDVAGVLKPSIDALLANTDLARPSDWDMDNVWGYVYGLQALSRVMLDARFSDSALTPRMRATGERWLAKLLGYQTPLGGWSYYARSDAAMRPNWTTSFTTAATVLALLDARRAGFEVPQKSLDAALAVIAHARLPSGAYTYNVEPITEPGSLEGINQVGGSLGRIQVCNLALFRGKPGSLQASDLERGLDLFFSEHRFLECARTRPIPHEAYYRNAGYFYYFGHYYAACLLQELPLAQRRAAAQKLADIVVGTQESDGSMWDYYMHSYPRPYSTAYGVMVLSRCLAALNESPPH